MRWNLRRPARALAAGLLAIATVACVGPRSQPPVPPSSEEATGGYPASTRQRVTTSADLYIGNLEARVQELERRAGADDRARVELAATLLLRAQILGGLEDAPRALELARAASVADGGAVAEQVLAAAATALHHFDEAAAALQRAEAQGADTGPARRDLALALGRYDELGAEFRRASEPSADFRELAFRADLRLLAGDPGGATLWYRSAQDLYHDVDPLPLAWLYTQQGIALLRHGDCAAARVFFAAAVARLPQYYLAAEHLAECEAALGDLESARSRYLAVIAQTGNPEFMAALADVEAARGDGAAAQRLRAQADHGFQRLLASQPAAWGQHAAEFYLDIGRSDDAHALALANARLRQDLGSLILLARTAAAVGDLELACRQRAQVLATGLRPPELAELPDDCPS